MIETIFSPALIQYHSLKGRTAVIIDVLRATTSICYALSEGASSLVPTLTPELCLAYREKGYLCAGERNGVKLEGFDMGNSPEEFEADAVRGRHIAITTTNGTQALIDSASADRILIGSFINLKAIAQFLQKEKKPITLVCAGWKNKANIEDTLFAGALSEALIGFEINCDSTLMAKTLWNEAKNRLSEVVSLSSHAQRFKSLGVDDLPFCLDIDRVSVVPEFQNGHIVLA